jgi:hypothetical protein
LVASLAKVCYFGCHPSVVTRTLKRVPVVELADAEHRKEAAARRAREYRDRQAEKAASPEALAEKLTGHPVDSADHLTIKTPGGDRIMFRSKKNGLWYREGVCGSVRAKRSDFCGKVPADFEAVPSYGPAAYPEHAREALGYVPPDQRPVRMSYVLRGVEHVSPVSAGEVPRRGEAERFAREAIPLMGHRRRLFRRGGRARPQRLSRPRRCRTFRRSRRVPAPPSAVASSCASDGRGSETFAAPM